MLKKSFIIATTAFGLTACSFAPIYEQYAKYKISDNDMAQVIAQFKPILYCIYPEAINKSHQDTYNLVYRKWSEAENASWAAIQYQIYVNTIGQRDTDLMAKDQNSLTY